MIDFTSATYLGLRHASDSLRPWARFTTGVPDALEAPEEAGVIARELSRMTGAESAMLARSTLHVFVDIVSLFEPKTRFYIDRGTYPIALWGVERAKSLGATASTFDHHDPSSLRSVLDRDQSSSRSPVVITDGVCPGCGKIAPLAAYLKSATAHGGALVVDDTQAFGVLGAKRLGVAPYGAGGGGSLVWQGVAGGENVVSVASLAKGFGVPLAFVAGTASRIGPFLQRSETRTHCSPASIADLRAAERALEANRAVGDRLRARLAGLVARFRRGLRERGLPIASGMFPVQSLAHFRGVRPETVHRRLEALGIRAVLHSQRCDEGVRVSLLINSSHSTRQIDAAIDAVAHAALTKEATRVR